MDRHLLQVRPQERNNRAGTADHQHRKSFYLKLFSLFAGLCICIPSCVYLFRTEPLGLDVPGLEETMRTTHRPLRRELQAIYAEQGYEGQRAVSSRSSEEREQELSFSPGLSKEYAALQKLLAPEKWRVFLESEERENEAYSSFLSSYGIYYDRYAPLDYNYYQLFLLNHPGVELRLGAYAPLLREGAALVERIIRESKEPLPLRRLFPEQEYPFGTFYRLLEKQMQTNVATEQFSAAADNAVLMLRLSSLLTESDAMQLDYLHLTLQTLSGILEHSGMDSESLKKILQELVHVRTTCRIPQKGLMEEYRRAVLKRFEQIRTNGLRLVLGDAMFFTGICDALRELDPKGAWRVVKSAVRDFFYDVDADEVLALRYCRQAISDEWIPYFRYKSLSGTAPGFEKYVIARKVANEVEANIKFHSEILARLNALEAGLRCRLADFGASASQSISPLSGKPIGIGFSPDFISVDFGGERELLIRRQK